MEPSTDDSWQPIVVRFYRCYVIASTFFFFQRREDDEWCLIVWLSDEGRANKQQKTSRQAAKRRCWDPPVLRRALGGADGPVATEEEALTTHLINLLRSPIAIHGPTHHCGPRVIGHLVSTRTYEVVWPRHVYTEFFKCESR